MGTWQQWVSLSVPLRLRDCNLVKLLTVTCIFVTGNNLHLPGEIKLLYWKCRKWWRNITFGNRIYNIPGWSISILLDYKSDVYNTAEVLSYLIPSIIVISSFTNQFYLFDEFMIIYHVNTQTTLGEGFKPRGKNKKKTIQMAMEKWENRTYDKWGCSWWKCYHCQCTSW